MATTKSLLKVAVIGPKGQCGSCVVDELLARGHTVTGISRNPPESWNHEGPGKYNAIAADLGDTKSFAETLGAGYDAIVCAYGPSLANLKTVYFECVEAHGRIKEALLASRHEGGFIVIGGAGSLRNKHGNYFSDEKDFCFAHWYEWPNQHLHYMAVRTADHGSFWLSRFIRAFWWARNNVEKPGWFSWMFRPAAWITLWYCKKVLTSDETKGLIFGSRVSLQLWEGVRDKKWSFLSPPWLLRDKGIRTGKYESFENTEAEQGHRGIEGGIYNEDMACAIADEVETGKFSYKHWTCTGPINLKEW